MTNAKTTSTINALLGPAAPELDCDVCFEVIDEYVDAVATGADPHETNPGMHAHLRGCPACYEEFDSLHTFVTTTDQGEVA